MRALRKNGWTYQSIADWFNLSYSTALYWCNKSSRNKQRAKNAKRKRVGEELKQRIKLDSKKRKENFKSFPEVKLRHALQSAIDEKRCKRKNVKGYNMKQARALLDSGKLKLGNTKIK
jgi:hypothetical protein